MECLSAHGIRFPSLPEPCIAPEKWLNLECRHRLSLLGSCYDMINSFFSHGLEETVVATILKEVLKAVCYLHEHSIIHK